MIYNMDLGMSDMSDQLLIWSDILSSWSAPVPPPPLVGSGEDIGIGRDEVEERVPVIELAYKRSGYTNEQQRSVNSREAF